MIRRYRRPHGWCEDARYCVEREPGVERCPNWDTLVFHAGDLLLDRTSAQLPAGLTHIGGKLDIRAVLGESMYPRGYRHPLPANLTRVDGDLQIAYYDHVLPAGLAKVGGSIDLGSYRHPLPASLASVGGNLYIHDNYRHPLPAGLLKVGGEIYSRNYLHTLPPALRGDAKARMRRALIRYTTTPHGRCIVKGYCVEHEQHPAVTPCR